MVSLGVCLWADVNRQQKVSLGVYGRSWPEQPMVGSPTWKMKFRESVL